MNPNTIVGLFYSDENNLVYEHIKYSENIAEEVTNKLKLLSFKFLGPLFLTESSMEDTSWKIDFIESSLSHYQERATDMDVIQSFFNLNSSIYSVDGITNLFTLIVSPYTEDIKVIYEKMVKYIHPCIIQGKILKESVLGGDFVFKKFIEEELERGINLIEMSLGSSRKMYWEEQSKYHCISFIERKETEKKKESNLYTCDIDDPIRTIYINEIPSYYIMSILPDYYESRIIETLKLFNKTSVVPNIRTIKLSSREKKVIYLEESLLEENLKKSYGVILVPETPKEFQSETQSFYKQKLRLILDKKKNMEETIVEINSDINPFERWATDTELGLAKIKKLLDKRE